MGKHNGNQGGRPRKEFDYDELDKLCQLQCTGEEISQFFGIDYDTLNNHIKEDYGYGFSEYFELKKGLGKIALRRKQMQLALSGNVAMLIFLGKNILDQSDKTVYVRKDGFSHMENKDILENVNRIMGLISNDKAGNNGNGNGDGNGNGKKNRISSKSNRLVDIHKGDGDTGESC